MYIIDYHYYLSSLLLKIVMACFLKFGEERKKQLNQIKIINEKLKKKCDACPHIFIEYLLWKQDMNFDQFMETDKASFFNKCNTIDRHMEIINDGISVINNKLKEGRDPCIFLNEIIKTEKVKCEPKFMNDYLVNKE